MTGVKERTTDSCVEEKQDEGKMASDKLSKSENDGSVENLANNLSALTIKREPVEDNEFPEDLITPKSSSKGDKSSVDYETKKPEVKKEVVTEPCQENSAFLTRGPTHGLATTNNIQHMGYNKGYGLPNAQTFKDKKRGREDDGNDPPLRYLRPGEEQFEFLSKDNSSLGMMVVKSPNKEITEMNFPPLNQDDILDMMDQQYSPYPSNNNGQFNVSSQSHSFNPALFSQNVYQPQQTVLSQTVNGNVVSNQQPRPNSIEQMYNRREPYTSESESESAKSPYSDQLYSPDNSSVKSINSPPPSNMSNDSGIIGDLTVNSPPDNASPAYDTALQSNYAPWDDQDSSSQISNQSMTSPPHMSSSQGMSQAGSPRVQQASSPMMQQTGSPMMQQTGSPIMPQVSSPMMQQTGSPMMQQTGSPMMQQTGSSMMQSVPCLAGNAMMPQQSRPHNITSSQPSAGSLGLPNLIPTQSNSGTPLTTSQQVAGQPGMLKSVSIPSHSQQFASHPGMVNSIPTTSHIGAPMMSQLPGQMGISHARVSQPNIGSPQMSQASVAMPQMMPSGPTMGQQNVQYMPSQTTAPQVSQLMNEQIDEKELNIVLEVLADDILESNNQKKMQKNQTSSKGMTVPSMAPPQNIVTSQQALPVPQNRNQVPGNKPLQNIQPVPNIMTTAQNQNRIPVTLVTNNMIPMATPIPMNSKLPITTAMTTPVLPQQPVSQAQMVLMPPGNQAAGNGIQTTGNVVQPPMIIILNNQNMNQAARNKPQPPKALKKILPKPGTSIPDSSKPANTAPVMSRNLNETGTRPVVPKPGQNQQTIYRQNLLNMARRTVADISRDRLRYQDDEGDTYLHVAVCKTDASMVQALIERLCREKLEVMIDATNCKRQTPLYLAVAANQPMMVHSLVARNANPCAMAQVYSNDGKTREVKTPLHVASSNGHTYLSTLQELIRSPAINLNIVNSEGHTALHCAILAHKRQNKTGQFIDSVPIIETLLKAGADPTSQDKKNGKTPLMYAIEKRDTALVERMLSMFESGEKLRNIIKFQTLDGSTCIKIAEGLKADFQPENWQRLLNTLNAALNGDPPRVMNGVM